MASSSKSSKLPITQSGVTRMVELKRLLLDVNNPRFGDSRGSFSSQTEVLDWIVENFGVNDVINSLAINGYFEAEPLVVEEITGTDNFVVKEGNRRLAACLILAEDDRASNQKQLRKSVTKLLKQAWSTDTKIPTICFKATDAARLVAYLGVRHIVSSQPWDSYAKAAWISSVVAEHSLTIEEIANLTGDKSQTIAKLLEGYNFIRQLESKGLFNPKTSYRRGKGSNVAFPFSWVYTILQYSTVREWLELEPYSTSSTPIPVDREIEAAALLTYMFGNKNTETRPTIQDSRNLGALAYSISVPVRRELLRKGATIDEIEESTRPPRERIVSLLVDVRQKMRDINGILSEESPTAEEASEFHEGLASIRKSTVSAMKMMEKLIKDDMDPDDD